MQICPVTLGCSEPTGPGFSRLIQGSVPGDLLTDLQTAGLIGDPLHELNFKNSLLWHNYTWTYTSNFSMAAAPGSTTLLVFDGSCRSLLTTFFFAL